MSNSNRVLTSTTSKYWLLNQPPITHRTGCRVRTHPAGKSKPRGGQIRAPAPLAPPAAVDEGPHSRLETLVLIGLASGHEDIAIPQEDERIPSLKENP